MSRTLGILAVVTLFISMGSAVRSQVFNDPATAGNVPALTVLGVPAAGGGVDINVVAAPGSFVQTYLATVPGGIDVGQYRVLLNPNFLAGEPISLFADTSGLASAHCPIPLAFPAGTGLYAQTLIFPPAGQPFALSNLSRVFTLSAPPIPPMLLEVDPIASPTAATQVSVTGRAGGRSREHHRHRRRRERGHDGGESGRGRR